MVGRATQSLIAIVTGPVEPAPLLGEIKRGAGRPTATALIAVGHRAGPWTGPGGKVPDETCRNRAGPGAPQEKEGYTPFAYRPK